MCEEEREGNRNGKTSGLTTPPLNLTGTILLKDTSKRCVRVVQQFPEVCAQPAYKMQNLIVLPDQFNNSSYSL